MAFCGPPNTTAQCSGALPLEPPEAAGTGPASVVGHHCEVQILEDSEWYRAIVRGFDRASKLHNLWYYYDGEVQPLPIIFPLHFVTTTTTSLIVESFRLKLNAPVAF